MNHRFTSIVMLGALALFLFSCGESNTDPLTTTGTDEPNTPVSGPSEEATDIGGGLLVTDLKIGTGKKVKPGSVVKVHATGRFTDGKMFWSSYTNGKPIDFPLMKGQVIDGWCLGIPGMREGGKRRLDIPYSLAYGESGKAPSIPAKADLVFMIELIRVVQ